MKLFEVIPIASSSKLSMLTNYEAKYLNVLSVILHLYEKRVTIQIAALFLLYKNNLQTTIFYQSN